jgi:hypothetical protein
MAGPAVLALLTVLGIATGCGGSADSSGERIEPKAWAKSVCGAVKPWSAEIRNLQEQARKKITTRSDVEQTKDELVALFGGMELATDAALRKVKKAGVPEVDDGQQIADQFVHALTAARDSFGTGMSAVQRLPTVDQNAFYDGVVAAGDAMSKENNEAGKAFANVSSPALDKAFDEVPECQ